jgi:HEAT repeat protein
MSSKNQDLIDQLLNGKGIIKQGEAAYHLAKSGDSDSINVLLDSLDKLDDGARANAVDMAVDGIFSTAPSSLKPLMDRLQTALPSLAADKAAYILGEVAFRQGQSRDPAILPALLQALNKNLDISGINAAMGCIYGVRECARAGSISAADTVMKKVLAIADQPQPEFNIWYLTLAIEVLAINKADNSKIFGSELMYQLQFLSVDSKLYQQLKSWIQTVTE